MPDIRVEPEFADGSKSGADAAAGGTDRTARAEAGSRTAAKLIASGARIRFGTLPSTVISLRNSTALVSGESEFNDNAASFID